MVDIKKHPCFNAEAKHTHARVHLPVAPKCNIQCGYCNRKFDCANESRPGVTSALLTPVQAAHYVEKVQEKMPELSTVGIAGPGDPFANPEQTMETLRLVRKANPDMVLCLSSNGVGIEPYIDEIAELEVSHVTLTINSIRPEVLANIYRWVRYDRKVYRGLDAGEVMVERQLKALEKLVAKDLLVKVNYVVIPGVNDHLIEETAAFLMEMGVGLFNPIPLLPTADTDFENHQQPDKDMMEDVKHRASRFLPAMEHCSRCRSDAVGMLGQDDRELQQELERISRTQFFDETRPNIAVATMEGYLVNQHLGEADCLHIFEKTEDEIKLLEIRKTPPAGLGNSRWEALAKSVDDCSMIVLNGIGHNPLRVLEKQGLSVIETEGLISELLPLLYAGKAVPTKSRANFKCGSECGGGGEGC